MNTAASSVLMEVFFGRYRKSAGTRPVELVGDGIAGSVACFECDGSGDWPFGPTPDDCGPCIDCKGTGRILVSI